MDPLTQGALGAALPLALLSTPKKASSAAVATPFHDRSQATLAAGLGLLGGMAPDLDVLIRSATDPLLFLTYHRQFTHSLFFIPIGGVLVALVVHLLFGRRWQLPLWQTTLYCTLGYATHALLDAATSYGTMLLWPFSQTRFAWSIVSIIDPLLTVPLALSVLLAAVWKRPVLARIGLGWVAVYLGLGWWQHETARAMAENLAVQRGHVIQRLEIKPSFGNILVWKSIYEAEGRYFVDAFRVGIAAKFYPGTSVAKLDLSRDFPWLSADTQQARDIQRFARFSNGFLAVDPADRNRIIDVRYSFVPNEINALFSIALSPDRGPQQHVRFQSHRKQARQQFGRLWALIMN